MTAIPLSRRGFLTGVGAACAAGAIGPVLRPQLALAEGAAHTLVVVSLDGGLDGISALVPFGDAAYGRDRSTTRLSTGQAIAVDGMFALHRALAPIADLWVDGLVAAIPAVGTVTQSRSHFDEMSVVASGTDGSQHDGGGWLARHLLTRAGGVASTLHGVSSGPYPALALAGHSGAFHVPDLASAGLTGWAPERLPAATAALSAAYATALPVLARPASVAFDAIDRLAAAAAVPAPGTLYDDHPWADQLRQTAQLIKADVGVEAAVVSFPGWDTHRWQGGADGRLAERLLTLARALAAFVSDLQDRLDRMTLVVLSEFGRRVDENGSGGTDHGTGGLALVLGRGLNGGVHGAWPGLEAARAAGGVLPVTTDIRSVLAEVVSGRLGNTALDVVFPGFTPVPLGIV